MSDTAADSAASACCSPCSLDAIQTLLTHDHGLLTIRELGRLSVCSGDVAATFDGARVWKAVFESTADAARRFVDERTNPWIELEGDTHVRNGWAFSSGLLECLADPDDAVIERVGYKRAAGCLWGKSCRFCGRMAANANPVAMIRVCKACAAVDEASFLITKSNAKEAFLLGENELEGLTSAAFEAVGGLNRTLLLMSDVREAAFAKYGGADGLAAEIARRTSAAVEPYDRSQGTSKPQKKKRPKIEKLSGRPADDLLRVKFSGPWPPVGTLTAHWHGNVGRRGTNPQLRMTDSVRCKLCDRAGTIGDVVMHERLDHGLDMRFGMTHLPSSAPRDISEPANVPGATAELVRVFTTASVTYSSDIEDLGEENEDGVCTQDERMNCLITLDPSGAPPVGQDRKITISVDKFEMSGEEFICRGLDICYQLGSGTPPIKLLHILDGGDLGPPPSESEASEDLFNDVKGALGLKETAPAQLLVMLMSRAFSLSDARLVISEDLDAFRPFSASKMPTLRAMLEILKSG